MRKQKSLTWSILAVLFLALFSSLAINVPVVHAEEILMDSWTDSFVTYSSITQNFPTYPCAFGTEFQVPDDGQNYILTQITLKLERQGTITGGVIAGVMIALDGSGYPTQEVLAYSSNNYSCPSISTDITLYNFTFTETSPSLTGSSRYAVLAYATEVSVWGSGSIRVFRDSVHDNGAVWGQRYYPAGDGFEYYGYDFYFLAYGEIASPPPQYSSVGNGAVHNGYAVSCYSYWTAEAEDLDGYYFEHNATGTPTNSSYLFVDQSEDWANGTVNLDADLGDVVAYQFFANTTSAVYNATGYEYFTVSATVNFYANTGGALRREGVTISNGTQTTYSSPTNLTMLGVASVGYEFETFSWYAGTETDDDNPLEWPVDWSTSFWCVFTEAAAAPTPPPYDPPVISDGDVILDLYFHADTQTVNNVTGYAALETAPDEEAGVEVDAAGDNTVTWGWRVYLQFDGSATELTNGSPVAQVSLDYTQEEYSLENNTYELDGSALIFGRTAIKLFLYYRWNDTGDWNPAAIFISDYLYFPEMEDSEVTFYYYIGRWEDSGYTYSSFGWGTDETLSGLTDLAFSAADASDYQGYYLRGGNFLSFLTIPYTAIIGNAFYAIVIFGIGMSLYIRYRQASILAFFIIILGGSGAAGVINLLIGDLFMGIVWIVVVFGLALVFWRVFR